MLKNDREGWDPASSVGLTATEAAAARAVASCGNAALISDPFAEPLVRALGVDFFIRLVEQNGETDASAFAMPGMVDWVAARTRFFDDYFTATQSAGIRQVVILGAGLDSRAFRLTWSPDSTVYEVDQPGVVHFKSATMARLGARPRVDHRTVAVDLRAGWVPLLRHNGFDQSVPTAWSAEGLLPYLPPDAQERLLDNVSELSAEGSSFAADTVTATDELAARIATSSSAGERPTEARIEIGAAIAASCRAQPNAARHLRLREWTSMGFAALDLFAAYDLPEPTGEDNLYHLIRFVTARRGNAHADPFVAGI